MQDQRKLPETPTKVASLPLQDFSNATHLDLSRKDGKVMDQTKSDSSSTLCPIDNNSNDIASVESQKNNRRKTVTFEETPSFLYDKGLCSNNLQRCSDRPLPTIPRPLSSLSHNDDRDPDIDSVRKPFICREDIKALMIHKRNNKIEESRETIQLPRDKMNEVKMADLKLSYSADRETSSDSSSFSTTAIDSEEMRASSTSSVETYSDNSENLNLNSNFLTGGKGLSSQTEANPTLTCSLPSIDTSKLFNNFEKETKIDEKLRELSISYQAVCSDFPLRNTEHRPEKKAETNHQVKMPLTNQEQKASNCQIPAEFNTKPQTIQSSSQIQDKGFLPKSIPAKVFIQIQSVKDIREPIQQGMKLCCILDNGKHRVKTPWTSIDIGETSIDQEFEVIAEDTTGFSLMLQTRYAPKLPSETLKPKSSFSKILSPKRHKAPKDVFFSLHGKIGPDGVFAKSEHVIEKIKEKSYLRVVSETVNCYNEWLKDYSSAKSDQKSLAAKLSIRYIYVPMISANFSGRVPFGLNEAAKDIEIMRQLKYSISKQQLEGYLSQQGGDCSTWRRRYFQLEGKYLIAYHELSKIKRFTVNLAKASALLTSVSAFETKTLRQTSSVQEIDNSLIAKDGFRIMFNNGREVDYYASNEEEQMMWVNAIESIMRNLSKIPAWIEAVEN